MLRYARGLEFDGSYHATDTRRLVIRENGRLIEGPLATIEPEIGVRSMKLSDIGSGRILARIASDGPFPSLGLEKGDNYMWVERAADGAYHAVMIPAEVVKPLRTFPLVVQHEVMSSARNLVEARFRWDDAIGGDGIWVPCGTACCRSDGGGTGPTKPPGGSR